MKIPPLLTAFAFLLARPANTAAAENVAPEFELQKWNTTEKVKLKDFTGQIVVLDFFAYWCVPCKRASKEIEPGIAKYYEAKQGNPHGAPVRVVAVNVESAKPEKTAQFIKDIDATFVANDNDAALFTKLGGKGTPFIVIIDGTRGTKDAPEFHIVYRKAGFEGTKKLREVIDAIRPAHTAEGTVIRASAIETATGPPVVNKGGAAFEALLASDIQLTTFTLNYGQQFGGGDWNVSYTHNTYGEDYEPYRLFDFLGFSERLEESYDGGQVALRQKLTDRLTLSEGGGFYDGFTDYRSVWLANYYRQQFNFVPGYEKPDPHGFNATAGLRWEYQPTIGFIEAGFLFGYDDIAPGYEYDQNLGRAVHGRDILRTYSPSLKFENVLTPRLRLLNEFQLTDTTDRELRFAYRNSVNYAIGERWVARLVSGYTREQPTLTAWNVRATVEWEFADRWHLNASGLYYHDTGEIENSLFISTAAPGVAIWQGGVGLRYAGERSSFSLAVAPVWSDYEPVEVGTQPFANLYRDRNWFSVQAAWSFQL
jgi:thiol-disulfide isomerase/thioredoxin